MLSAFEKKYTAWAVLIWSVVGMLVGMVAGVAFGWQGKMLAFLVVLGLGVVWLIAIQLIKEKKENQKMLTAPITKTEVLTPPPTRLEIPRHKKDVRVLSKDEAREWLDAFLIKQQNR